MSSPNISNHFKSIKPSSIRAAQIAFLNRLDDVKAINASTGNVSLPMHPAMKERMFSLNSAESPFVDGIVKYSQTVGFEETNKAFLNIIASSGFGTDGLYSQITDGGSQAMELVLLGVTDVGAGPILMIDPAYTNYKAMAKRTQRDIVSFPRDLDDDGKFSLPEINAIEEVIKKHNPSALVVIPYDNPTGHYYSHSDLIEIAKICVKHNMWMISDEAYRELNYTDDDASSIWKLSAYEVPGIEGRRISIETASKVWNACGLRIGAIVTDSEEFHKKSVAENTANLCSNVIGQYIFGALANESHEDLQKWYSDQRNHYQNVMSELKGDLVAELPGIIVSSPDSSIYTVVDFKNIAKPGFDSAEFVLWCASEGKVDVDGEDMTFLASPMASFYNTTDGESNPGSTQVRIAFVLNEEETKLIPPIFAELFRQYEAKA
jgi:aspartate aminotransferase